MNPDVVRRAHGWWGVLLMAVLGLVLGGCDAIGKGDGEGDGANQDEASSSKKEKDKSKGDDADEDDEDDAPKKKGKKAKKDKDKKGGDDAEEEEDDEDDDASFAPPPLAVGQWIRFSIAEGPRKSTYEYRVVAESGSTKTFELDIDSPDGKVLVEFVIDVQDQTKLEGLVVKSARTKTNTGVVTVPPSGVETGMSWMLKILLRPKPPATPREEASVAAGKFDRCFLSAFQDTFLGQKIDEKRWVSSKVPINGFVKGDGTIDKTPRKSELLAFGTSGAEAKF